ncbi:MAG: NAD-dependent epimerase [Prevotellaceae bacterium]|nr:NAD-dependent epimerase [Prevotellaceae bacterium]
MKILVTGTAGFIGFHLAKRLVLDGYDLVGLDSINDYYAVSLKFERLAESGIAQNEIEYGKLLQSKIHNKYRFVKLNLEDRENLEKLFEAEKFDFVVNLAAQAGVRYSIENPHAYVQSNLAGFVNVLECCRHNGVKHLVYASSSSVYGNAAKIPFSETDRVDFPVSLYAATKKANELMAHTYSHLYKLPTTGLRFFTVYGEWGRPDMSPILFADAITNSEPIKVFNHGDMSRDFTYIDDIVEGIVRLLTNSCHCELDRQAPEQTGDSDLRQNDGCSPYYRLFNIGNSQPVQLMDFIRTMEDALGKKAILKMYPMQAGDVKTTYADTTELEKVTHYKPSTSLKVGLEKFAKWYKNSTHYTEK